jgi:dephospho-CoA kinase
VSSPEKAALAKKNGYKWVIDYTKENVAAKVKEITKGKGVPVVFDGVGKDTWEASLDSLQPRGLLASFGNASGPVAPVPPGVLNTKGSLYLTRPSLGAYTATRKDLEASAKSLFKMVKSGKVKIAIDQRYPLAEAGQAHTTSKGARRQGRPSWSPDKPGVQRSMMIVGLTGSIGMGKSTAARMLRQMGVPRVRRRRRRPRPAGAGRRGAAADRGGVSRRGEDGVLDRQALGARVFGNKQALRKLEAIVHPLVGQRQRAFLKRAARQGEKLVVLDIPLLFEGLGDLRVDATLVVSAPVFLQRHRVMARPGMTADRLDGILRQQVPDVLKRHKADIVIPTGLGLAPTRAALAKAVAKLRRRRGRFWPPNPWREKHTARLAQARRK